MKEKTPTTGKRSSMSARMGAVLLLVSVLVMVAGPASAEQLPVREYKLDNGLRVYMLEDHKAPLVAFQLWYLVGSRNEPGGQSGISHVLEHMMFKGTEKYDSKEFSKRIQRVGGYDNAYTSLDVTVYHQMLPSERIDMSIELESDRMVNLKLEAEEVASERKVVMEERRLRYEDSPSSSMYEEILAAAYKVHPYHSPVIGWMEDLEKIDRDDLLEHYRLYYRPDNAFIVVVGDIEPEELFERIEEKFGQLEAPSRKLEPVSQEPPQKGERRITLRRSEVQLPQLSAVYHVPNFPHPDSYALEVLAHILSAGESSRLHRSLVYEQKIALSAGAGYGGGHMDPFLFFLDATAAPGSSLAELEDRLYEEVEKIKNAAPGEFELQKAKNQLEADFIMDQDSIQSQARTIGTFEMLGDWRLMDQYLKGIRAVSAGDVQRVASKYLVRENRTVGLLLSPDAKKGEGESTFGDATPARGER